MTLQLRFIACALLPLIGPVIASADKPKNGAVTLSLKVDGCQPAGWPILVDVTVTNTGNEKVDWWCGGPDTYPPAHHFAVSVRYGADTNWHDVTPSNGQCVEGSGSSRNLAPGKSIQVPLAVPIDFSDTGDSLAEEDAFMGGVTVRVSTCTWASTSPAEMSVTVSGRKEHLDRRRGRVIRAAAEGGAPFWMHVGECYPDAVVLDAMLKLVTVDCVPIAAGAARLLARQPTLPEKSGEDFALLVMRWIPRSPKPKWGGLRENILTAALKTQSEPGRKAVLGMLKDTPNERTRWILINALRLSPGDQGWLERARDAILEFGATSPDDEESSRVVNLATDWLDSRLENEYQKPVPRGSP